MAIPPSTMLDLGTPAPEINLPDVVSGEQISLATFADDQALLVMFLCRHCPFVLHVKHELSRLGQDYAESPLGIAAISSNDAETYPNDAPEHLKAMAEELDFKFAFCYDETQEVAKTYSAACTPDFFLFDGERKLVYRGQLDDARPENGKPIDGRDLRAAIEAVLAGEAVSLDQKPSVGCNIKWKPGNAPGYFAS